VQIGQGRGGWYSYDWLENLVGLDIHTTDQIRPEWQRLQVGDPVVTVRAGWRPLPDGFALTVARLEPARALVLRQQPPESPWDGVWSFHLLPDGPGRTRLVSRGRTHLAPGPGGVLQRLGGELMAPATFIMTRAMLLGIKRRAERSQRPLAAVA
jgi:hypothetical protein